MMSVCKMHFKQKEGEEIMKNKLNDERIRETDMEKSQKGQEFLNVINSRITGVKNRPHR